jgi:DNA-binding NarL/FixJ family response regulator
LHFLNKGVKSEDIALYIPLSSSSVKTRKERMKALLGMEESTDEDFIKVAKSKGMLQ